LRFLKALELISKFALIEADLVNFLDAQDCTFKYSHKYIILNFIADLSVVLVKTYINEKVISSAFNRTILSEVKTSRVYDQNTSTFFKVMLYSIINDETSFLVQDDENENRLFTFSRIVKSFSLTVM